MFSPLHYEFHGISSNALQNLFYSLTENLASNAFQDGGSYI